MKSVKFFEDYPTREALEAELRAHPERYGEVTVSQFLKDNLPLEKAFQAEILQNLRSWRELGLIDPHALIWKQSAGVYNRNGMPDVMAVVSSRFVAFEVKRPYIGAATQLQQKTMRQIQEAGGIAGIVSFPGEAEALLVRAGIWCGPLKDCVPEDGGEGE